MNNYDAAAIARIEECITFKRSYLDLSNLNLSVLPDELFDIIWLKKLIISKNYIHEISFKIKNLIHLSELDISNNILRSFPDGVLQLKNLSKLDISNNQIDNIPENIGKINNINLKEVNFSKNKIKQIPESIQSLSMVSKLNFSGNELSAIPEGVTKLRYINELDLSYNKFEDVPEYLFYMNNNRVSFFYNPSAHIYLNNNPIIHPPIEIINQGNYAVRNYFKELGGGEEFLYEAKLLIVGEPGAGKTTLTRKILNPEYELISDEKSTEGIEVSNYIFSFAEGNKFYLNIWDFGGQEIYHSTHQFFLTKRSLYVLLSDSRAENTDFNYWLNVIELLSSNSPIIIVQNEKQERRKELNTSAMRGRFSNLQAVLQTNLYNNRGLNQVISSIKHHVSILPHIGTKLPKSWLSIRRALEEKAKSINYISLSEFIDTCHKFGLTEEKRCLHLSEYLHDLGVFLHFQDNVLLKKIVILNPVWGTTAVYKVLDNWKIANEQKGVFIKDDLLDIWSEPEYCEMRDELLELMIKFELSYYINESQKYIAPQLLAVEQPIYSWPTEPSIIVKYRYDFMPKGLMTRFIVRMHEYIAQNDWVWKEGVVLIRKGVFAEVTEQYGLKEIYIKVTGIGIDNRRELLILILEEFDRMHRGFNKIVASKLVLCNCSECIQSDAPHFFKYEVLEKYRRSNIPRIRCELSLSEISVASILEGTFGKDDAGKSYKKICVLYSDVDDFYREDFIKYVSQLKNQHKFEIWDNTKILPGRDVSLEMDQNMNSADIIIVLVSPDFVTLEADIIRLENIKKKNKTDIIPLYIRPSMPVPVLDGLSGLPKSRKYLNVEGIEKDEIWQEIIIELSRIL